MSGYQIEFDKPPIQFRIPREIPFQEEQRLIIDNEVKVLLEKGAIVQSKHEAGEFISTIFIVPKPNGKFRPVINLRYLNEFVHYEHFKQETFKVVLDLVQEGDFFTSIDLQDAYFSIPICESFQKFLKFSWRGQLYKFTCLPFGISSAPRLFTKILKPVYSWFRYQGFRCSYYIDDSLNMNKLREVCQLNTMTMMEVLKSLGFTISDKKSVVVPTQRITFFGFILDSVRFMVFLPEDKVQKISKFATELLQKKIVKVRQLASFIGCIINAFHAILEAPMQYRCLERDKIKGLGSNRDFENFVDLSLDSVKQLNWWIENVHLRNGKRIRPKEVSLHVCTDASQIGWGGLLQENGIRANGRWNNSEAVLPINCLELLAVYYSLQSLFRDSRDVHIQVLSDNVSAVAYVNDMGGMTSVPMDNIAKDIWTWCLQKDIYLSAVYLPGTYNVEADYLSRHFSDTTEWMLKSTIFERITRQFFRPDIDLFASRLNARLDSFMSWFPEPGAKGFDAFSISWKGLVPYLFPPFNLVGKVINKVLSDEVDQAILVFPFWKSQAWFPLVLANIISFPVRLPRHQDLLTLPHNGQCHPLAKALDLVAVIVSANHSRVKDFQRKLGDVSCHHGEEEHVNSMGWHGENGIFGVCKAVKIPFRPLKL